MKIPHIFSIFPFFEIFWGDFAPLAPLWHRPCLIDYIDYIICFNVKKRT